MANHIQLGSLSLDPIEIGSQGNAILGIRDSGKSYTATYLAERLFEAGIPFVAFDPIGVWRFLRVPGGPKGKGYPIVVAGGEDGDLPLNPASAPMIVEAAMQNGVSLVIDLFDMHISKADWRRIVKDCVKLLLHRNKQYGLRHIFLEEAAEFAPQKVNDGDVYAEIEKLARMGGNSRLGYTLINQRSQEVNKAVLELCDNLFLHRQKGKNSLENLKKWLEVAGAAAEEVMHTIPTMPQGECWAWVSSSDTPVHVKVPAKRSLHPDRRIVHNEIAAEVVKKAAVNVDGFVAALKEALPRLDEEAKANDPKALKAEIQRLARELSKAEKAKAPQPAPVFQLPDPDIDAAKEAARREGIAEGLRSAVEAISALAGGKVPAARPARLAAVSVVPVVAREPAPTGGPGQRILNALAWWRAFGHDRPLNEQVAFIAGYTHGSGGYNNPRGALKSAGLIDYPEPGRVSLTDAGGAQAEVPDAPPSGEELRRRVLGKLAGPQQRILTVLIDAYPESVSNEECAAKAGYQHGSGGYNNPRGNLKTLNIISYPTPGYVRAADWLLP